MSRGSNGTYLKRDDEGLRGDGDRRRRDVLDQRDDGGDQQRAKRLDLRKRTT